MDLAETSDIILKANGKVVGCLQSLGDIKQKRDSKTYEPINCDDVITILGNIKVDPISMGVLLDGSDTEGQKELKTAFNNKTKIPFSIELGDKPDGGTNGTTFSWDSVGVDEFNISPEPNGVALATFNAVVSKKPTTIEPA